MLGILLIIATTYFGAKWRGMQVNLYTLTNQKNVMALILILTILFWIVHALFSKNKDVRRYGDNWDVDSIKIVRGILTVVQAVCLALAVSNIHDGEPIYHNLWIWIGSIVVLNIVEFAAIDQEYSLDARELIVDTVLMQIRDARNTLALLLIVLVCYNVTIFGVLFIIAFFAIIFRW
jgi:hypothetical protein